MIGPHTTANEQAVADAYQREGVPLDALAYTPSMRRITAEACVVVTDESLRATHRALVAMRRRGVLPRIGGER